jgi:hypothetical protein
MKNYSHECNCIISTNKLDNLITLLGTERLINPYLTIVMDRRSHCIVGWKLHPDQAFYTPTKPSKNLNSQNWPFTRS